MERSLASRFVAVAFAALVAGACGAHVTSVGGLAPGDTGDAATDAFVTDAQGDASETQAQDVAVDAVVDGPCDCTGLVCGRVACGGHQCGACAGAVCSGGHCVPHCEAGAPCVDEISGEHVCPGDLGAQHCAGGVQGFRVCGCDGSGTGGWIACGACL